VIIKTTGDNCPKYWGRGLLFSRIAFFLIFCVLNFKPALAQEMPVLYGISPPEGHLGEELRLLLDGDGFFQLEVLVSVNISGVQIPFSNYAIIDDQTIEVFLRIPEQTPTGEQKISFTFDNEFGLEALFVVLEPSGSGQESPLLYGVSPQEGHPGEQLPITLDGEGLLQLGDPQAVVINGMDAALLDYNLASDQVIEVFVRIPKDAPPGEGDISFFFENGDLNAYFVVIQPGAPPPEGPPAPPPEGPGPPSFRGVFPREARVESELRLRLDGENLSQLGDLQAVNINGVDIPVLDFQILSDQAIETLVQVPADIPAGDGQISFFFDNSAFEAPFTIRPAIPPPRIPIEVIVGVAVVAGLLGFIGRGLFRKPRPPAKSPPQAPPPEFHFKSHMDPGSQTIETTGPSINADIDIRLITTLDYGVQNIEVEQDSLTAE
jgi:hypothetical protein